MTFTVLETMKTFSRLITFQAKKGLKAIHVNLARLSLKNYRLSYHDTLFKGYILKSKAFIIAVSRNKVNLKLIYIFKNMMKIELKLKKTTFIFV